MFLKIDFSGRGPVYACQKVEDCSFAGSVGTDETIDLTLAHTHIQIIYGYETTELDGAFDHAQRTVTVRHLRLTAQRTRCLRNHRLFFGGSNRILFRRAAHLFSASFSRSIADGGPCSAMETPFEAPTALSPSDRRCARLSHERPNSLVPRIPWGRVNIMMMSKAE